MYKRQTFGFATDDSFLDFPTRILLSSGDNWWSFDHDYDVSGAPNVTLHSGVGIVEDGASAPRQTHETEWGIAMSNGEMPPMRGIDIKADWLEAAGNDSFWYLVTKDGETHVLSATNVGGEYDYEWSCLLYTSPSPRD